MRRGLLVCLPGLMVACAPGDSGFEYRSTLDNATRGLALHADGQTGHAGMFRTNCPFETVEGSVTGDYDLPDSDEQVQDAGTSLLGDDSVLLVISDDVYVLRKDGGSYEVAVETIPGVVEARLSAGGLVALTDDGGRSGLTWSTDDGLVAVDAGSGLPIAFDVDPTSGTAVVARTGGISLVDRDTSTDLTPIGDLVAWDPAVGAVYVALAGDSLLEAYDADGAQRWMVDLGAPIVALSDAGAREAAAVVLEYSDGRGELLYVDGWTGSILAGVPTPAAADGITVSADGSVAALVRDDATHFYEMNGGFAR